MLRLLIAGPLAVVAAAFGAAFGVLAVVSPRGLANLLVSRAGWRKGSMITISGASSRAEDSLRIVARAFGAFGAARVVLFAFSLGPVWIVALSVAVILAAWDVYWLWFLSRMSFSAPTITVELHRTRVATGAIVSTVAALLFVNT